MTGKLYLLKEMLFRGIVLIVGPYSYSGLYIKTINKLVSCSRFSDHLFCNSSKRIVFESFLFLCLELQSRHLCFFLLLMSFSFLRIIYLANCFGSWMLSPIQFQSLNYCRFCDHRQIKPSTVPILSYVELLN